MAKWIKPASVTPRKLASPSVNMFAPRATIRLARLLTRRRLKRAMLQSLIRHRLRAGSPSSDTIVLRLCAGAPAQSLKHGGRVICRLSQTWTGCAQGYHCGCRSRRTARCTTPASFRTGRTGREAGRKTRQCRSAFELLLRVRHQDPQLPPQPSGRHQDRVIALVKRGHRNNPEALQKKVRSMLSQTKPFVSVIVPIFNTADYLQRCLQSLLASTLENIEIICVDDASTDRSAEIVAQVIEQDRRVKLIRHRINLGQGGARNTGIAAAQADYVGGVDSDDWVSPTMYEKLFAASGGSSADIVECGYSQIGHNGHVLRVYKPQSLQVDNTGNQINIFEANRPSFCTKIWRRTLFTSNDIWFPEKTLFEDLATTPRLVAKATDIRFIEDCPYNYCKREGSSTFSASESTCWTTLMLRYNSGLSRQK